MSLETPTWELAGEPHWTPAPGMLRRTARPRGKDQPAMTGSALAPFVIPFAVTPALFFWLFMIYYADRHPGWHHREAPEHRAPETGPARLPGAGPGEGDGAIPGAAPGEGDGAVPAPRGTPSRHHHVTG